jgi:hypothetical protein
MWGQVNILAEVGADDLHDLAPKPNRQEDDTGPYEIGNRPTRLRGVDEVAKNLWIEQIQPDPGRHTEAE